jgi:hypothetical protein
LLMQVIVGVGRSVHLIDTHGQGVHVANHSLVKRLKNRKTFCQSETTTERQLKKGLKWRGLNPLHSKEI